MQAVVLTFFVAVPIRQASARVAIYVMALWIVLELVCMVAVTRFLPNSAERAIGDGFSYRTALLLWLYAGDPLPNGFVAAPSLAFVGVLPASSWVAYLQRASSAVGSSYGR